MNDDDLYTEYLECICTDPHCLVRATIIKDEYPCDPEFYLEFQVNHWLPLHKRIWAAMVFVFTGRPPREPWWGSVALNEQSVNKFARMITSFRMLLKLRAAKRSKDK